MSSLYTCVLCQSKTEAGGRVLTIPKLSLSSDGETSDLSPALLPAPPPAPPLAPPEYTQMVANLMDFKVTTCLLATMSTPGFIHKISNHPTIEVIFMKNSKVIFFSWIFSIYK